MAQPLYSPHTTSLLKAHQFQGNSNDCGPYSAAVAITALSGYRIEGKKLADEMNKIFQENGSFSLKRIPHWITFPWGIIDVFKLYHFDATFHCFVSEKKMLEYLRSGKIIVTLLGKWLPLWAHYAILTSYHDKVGFGFVNPAIEKAQIYWLSHHTFYSQWNTFGRCIILVQ